MLSEAVKAKSCDALEAYCRKYAGEPSDRGVKDVDLTAYQELKRAYRAESDEYYGNSD